MQVIKEEGKETISMRRISHNSPCGIDLLPNYHNNKVTN
jgi:hypothetical protein